MLQIPLQIQNNLNSRLFKITYELSKLRLYNSTRLRKYAYNASGYIYESDKEIPIIMSPNIGIKIYKDKFITNEEHTNFTEHINTVFRNLRHELLFCKPVEILYYIEERTLYIDNSIPSNILKMILKNNKASCDTLIYKDDLKQYFLKEGLPFTLTISTIKSEFDDFIKHRDILL